MNKEELQKMYEQEQDNWWYAGKRWLVFCLLNKFNLLKKRKQIILNIGCGTGQLMTYLNLYGETYGIDASAAAVDYCKTRGLYNIRSGDAENLPYQDESFDLALALDIFEHLPDDQKALQEAWRVLRNGGHLLLTVPAYQFLWSGHDEALGHVRRYNKMEVGLKVRDAGFIIKKLSYTNFFIFPLVYILRKLKKGEGSDNPEVPGVLNSLFKSLYLLESKLLNWFDLPLGVSLICLAQKDNRA
ncbi:class I SAM-dependent methyltransferase [Candidatus Margulisiibacteriota bacterium]